MKILRRRNQVVMFLLSDISHIISHCPYIWKDVVSRTKRRLSITKPLSSELAALPSLRIDKAVTHGNGYDSTGTLGLREHANICKRKKKCKK